MSNESDSEGDSNDAQQANDVEDMDQHETQLAAVCVSASCSDLCDNLSDSSAVRPADCIPRLPDCIWYFRQQVGGP